MSEYFLAPALVQLRDEVNKRFPNRDKASDGWIGDPSHAARPSDHNPDWTGVGKHYGIVRALDIDISPDGRPNVDLRRQLLRQTVGDPRVWYVISNGKIYSRTHDWQAREYLGSNPHFEHVHISLNGANGVNPDGNFDTKPWWPVKEVPVMDTTPRVVRFRDSRPEWDVKILDRAIAAGRRDLVAPVKVMEDAVDKLPHDKDEDSRVHDFKEIFEVKRELHMRLLNEAVQAGRTGAVKKQRDRIQAAIKSVLWK